MCLLKSNSRLRTQCLVVGCKRRTSREFEQWICGVHWRAVPVFTRRRYAVAKARCRRHGASYRYLVDLTWLRCIDAAQRAAAGL